METKSVKDQMVKLVELQAFDAEIYQYKKTLRQSPEQVKALQDAFEQKKQRLKSLEDNFKVKQLERKEKEVDLQAKEADIQKTNAQLSQLKTNKDYKSKLTEIEGLKADQSIIEEKILILFDVIDRLSADLEKEKSLLAQEEQKFLAQKKQVEETAKELEDKIKVLENKRKQVAVEISPQILSRYERILIGKEGLAIVPVVNHSCTGCYMNVPVQQINEIKKHEDLIYCEMCARILYTEEDL